MYQKEFQFFWPLTEQIPLDLDYAPCEAPKLTLACDTGGITIAYFPTAEYGTAVMTTIKAQELTLTTPYMPWYRKLAFKLIGIKWE